MPKKLTDLAEIVLEPQDSQIFNIPDVKTRITTLQNYFFPRMEMLLRHTLALVQEVYGVNPYERMTFVYHPSNRKDVKAPRFFPCVYVGICGKRRTDRVLITKRRDGKPRHFHMSYLTYTVYPEGCMHVDLNPFIDVDKNLVNIVSKLIRKHTKTLWPILSMHHITYRMLYTPKGNGFTVSGPEGAFALDDDGATGSLHSPYHYFPVDMQRGLKSLMMAFVALYPIVDSIVMIEEGDTPRLGEMLAKLQTWYVTQWQEAPPEESKKAIDEDASETEAIQIPELESYTYVRAGLWWEVLARDNWTCRSCGRSTKHDGVVLHVDHILPRSKGGTDQIGNLQTLCSKCNIGKSNRDDTDLRTM